MRLLPPVGGTEGEGENDAAVSIAYTRRAFLRDILTTQAPLVHPVLCCPSCAGPLCYARTIVPCASRSSRTASPVRPPPA